MIVFRPPEHALVQASTKSRDETSPARLLSLPAPDSAALVGSSAAIDAVRNRLARLALSDVDVLITGESGTGKELAARLLHDRSGRRRGRFVIVNCPAISESLAEAELFGTEKGVATGVTDRAGLLETADGGTLFLDEVADLAPRVQATLLRFLQERTVERVGARSPRRLDVRVVAATHADLDSAVAAGRVREDLYHRLRVASVAMPPLRERMEDIAELAAALLLRTHPTPPELSPEALADLGRRPFPGNVRELENALRGAAATCHDGVIRVSDLPSAARARGGTPAAEVDALLAAIRDDGRSFWDVVKDPFLARKVSRDTVLELIERAHDASGRRLVATARFLGVGDQYKKFADFLRNHDLGPR